MGTERVASAGKRQRNSLSTPAGDDNEAVSGVREMCPGATLTGLATTTTPSGGLGEQGVENDERPDDERRESDVDGFAGGVPSAEPEDAFGGRPDESGGSAVGSDAMSAREEESNDLRASARPRGRSSQSCGTRRSGSGTRRKTIGEGGNSSLIRTRADLQVRTGFGYTRGGGAKKAVSYPQGWCCEGTSTQPAAAAIRRGIY